MCIKCYEFIMEAQELLTQNFWERYHFEEKDWELAGAAARFLSGMVKVRAAVENRGDHAVCAVTLGGGYDELEDVVERSGNLFLAYCVECLGMEFLEQAYERLNQAVHDEQGKWLGNYHFLEEMQEEPVCDACGITMKKGMLHPAGTDRRRPCMWKLRTHKLSLPQILGDRGESGFTGEAEGTG